MLNFGPYYLTLLSQISHPTVSVPLSSPILSLLHERPHSITPFFWPTLAPSSPYCPLCHPLSHPLNPFLPHIQIPHHSITSVFFSSLIILSFRSYSILSPLLLTLFSQPISSHLNHHSQPVYPNYLLTTSISLHSLHASLLTSHVSQPTFFEISFFRFTQFSNAYQGHSLIPLSNPTLSPLIPLSHHSLTPV